MKKGRTSRSEVDRCQDERKIRAKTQMYGTDSLLPDRIFMRHLMESFAMSSVRNSNVEQLACNGVVYLQNPKRTWRTKTENHSPNTSANTSLARQGQSSGDLRQHLVDQLGKINTLFLDNKYKECIDNVNVLLQRIEDVANLPDKVLLQIDSCSIAGKSCFQLDDDHKAIAYFKRQLELARNGNPKHKIGLLTAIDDLIRVNMKLNKYEDALALLHERLQLEPRSAPASSVWVHYEIGNCLLELGDIDGAVTEAEIAYKSSLELDNDNWGMDCSILLAKCLLSAGDLVQARSMFRRAGEYSKTVGDDLILEDVLTAIKELNSILISKKEITKKDATEFLLSTTNSGGRKTPNSPLRSTSDEPSLESSTSGPTDSQDTNKSFKAVDFTGSAYAIGTYNQGKASNNESKQQLAKKIRKRLSDRLSTQTHWLYGPPRGLVPGMNRSTPR